MCHIFIYKGQKYNSYINGKTGGDDEIVVSKGILLFKYFPKE